MSLSANTALPVRLFLHASDENSPASAASVSSPIPSASLPADIAVRRGFLGSGIAIVNKLGRNPDIDTVTIPEDVWNGGGTYTGFPTGSPETLEVFSSSASDTGTLTMICLLSSASTAYTNITVTLNGTTPVTTAQTVYRMHSAFYNSGSATAFNLGTITVRHSTTTANVFCVMPIGRSQTQVACYTVPSGQTGYIVLIHGSARVSAGVSTVADCELWVRTNGASPRLRRSFTLQNNSYTVVPITGGLEIPALSDVVLRVTNVSASNTEVAAGFDLVQIPV